MLQRNKTSQRGFTPSRDRRRALPGGDGRGGAWGPSPGPHIDRLQQGFTLLELMVAVSILALALTWLVEATMRAVDAENHAKLVTTATFLARQVMVELEDELQEKGIQDDAFASEKEGTFEEAGFKRFVWRRVVDKIVLPGQSDVQSAMSQVQGGGLGGLLGGKTPDPNNPSGGAGALGGIGALLGGGATATAGQSTSMFASQFGLVKELLEQGIRLVTVKVVWTERGREQYVEVKEYLTDLRRVDMALGGGLGAQAGNLVPGASGSGASGNSPGSSSGSSSGGTTGTGPSGFSSTPTGGLRFQ